jgi:hypothetical protein
MAPSSIYLANVELGKIPAGPGGLAARRAAARPEGAVVQASAPGDISRIVAVRKLAASSRAGGEAMVEIEVSSSRAFPVTDALPTLTIGKTSVTLSRFTPGGPRNLVFLVPAADYGRLSPVSDVSLRIGGAPMWRFGRFNRQ